MSDKRKNHRHEKPHREQDYKEDRTLATFGPVGATTAKVTIGRAVGAPDHNDVCFAGLKEFTPIRTQYRDIKMKFLALQKQFHEAAKKYDVAKAQCPRCQAFKDVVKVPGGNHVQ